MSALAPAWALGAQAIDAQGSPHVNGSVHYRVLPHPRFGLPLAPLAVYYINYGKSIEKLGPMRRTDVRWVDSHGAVLTPPFDVTPGNPVIGYLPIGINARCAWVRVHAKPAEFRLPWPVRPLPEPIDPTRRPLDPIDPTRRPLDPIDPTRRPLDPIARPLDPIARPRDPRARPEVELDMRVLLRDRPTFRDLIRNMPWRLKRSTLYVDAWRSTPYGMQTIVTRDEPLYDLGSSDIHGVLVRGNGRVSGLEWVDFSRFRFDQMRPRHFLTLPVTGGARYSGLPDGPARARQAVERGAPNRLGMHDAPNASSPSACPSANLADELARLDALEPGTLGLVDRVLNDLSDRPLALMEKDQVATTNDGTPTWAHYPALHTLLTGAADPTIGRYLGLLDRDVPHASEGDILLYLIRGFFGVDMTNMYPKETPQLLELVLAYQRGGAPDPAFNVGLPFEPPTGSPDKFPIVDFFVPAMTTLGAPPMAPQRPEIGPPVPASTGDTVMPADPGNLGHWNADYIPPEARREIELPVSELLPVCGLAAARVDNGSATGLNRTFAVSGSSVPERARSLVPMLPSDADQPSLGRVHDRHAPPDEVDYRVAQHDWFGRWSPWAGRTVLDKSRPRPPKPVLRGHYTMADVPEPMHEDPLFGTLEVRVRVPEPDYLPTGGHLLAKLEVSGTLEADGGPVISLSHTPATLDANPALWPDEMVVQLTPTDPQLLTPRGQATATLTAVWVDTENHPSDPSDEVEVLCVDPRPPPPVIIDPSLRYAARPDAVGRARVTLTWPVAAGQHRFRVYFSDETRLIDRMKVLAAGQDPLPPPDPGAPSTTPSPADVSLAGALVADWEAAGDDAPARAAAFTDGDRPALLLKGFFQQVTREPLTVGSGATTMRFQHDLSASLRVLAFYRVVSVSAQNVEGAWTSTPIVPFGVPSMGPPTQPLLETVKADIESDPPLADGAVRLRVRVLRGPQEVSAYRLRRSSVTGQDPRRMMIVKTGSLALDNTGDAPIEFDIDDSGTTPQDPAAELRPFTRYSWRVEVQAPPLPGSTLFGEWSQSSPAVVSMLVPPAPTAPVPDALGVDTSDPSDKRVTLTFHHAGPLDGGTLGRYRFDIYRSLPGGAERRVGSLEADKTLTSFSHDDSFGTDDPPSGTTYRLVALDPTGRTSPPSDPMTIP